MWRAAATMVFIICLAAGARAGELRFAPEDTALRRAIEDARIKSATLDGLLERIDRADVITYVRWAPLTETRRDGFVTWLTRAGGRRYLIVSVSRRVRGAALVALLAHELQHVCEIAAEPAIVDLPSLERFYVRYGEDCGWHAGTRYFDSHAANVTGAIVLKELIDRRAGEAEAARR